MPLVIAVTGVEGHLNFGASYRPTTLPAAEVEGIMDRFIGQLKSAGGESMRTHLFSPLIVGTLILLGLKGTSLGDVVISPPESVAAVSDPLMMWLRCAVVCASGLIYWGGVLGCKPNAFVERSAALPIFAPAGPENAFSGWLGQSLLLAGSPSRFS
jgi:hypothetical protein